VIDIDELKNQYELLLIKQYYEKPKALAEVGIYAQAAAEIASFYHDIFESFDLDSAVGVQLDVIGRILGLPRIVPFVIEKEFFGFDGDPTALGFDEKFLIVESAPFKDKFEPAYTSQQLNDDYYRFFLKAKAITNNSSAYLYNEERINITDVISFLFDDRAYVLDNQDMTLTLYVSPTFSLQTLRGVINLNLLPKPQGVRYYVVIQAEPNLTFGFADAPDSQPWDDKFNPDPDSGIFAEKVTI
jgi:hypothetical protein